MVPRHAFPPGAERIQAAHFQTDLQGFVDTGYACRLDRETDTVAVTGPPAGLVTVGGCRFALRSLQEAAHRVGLQASLVALPDALSGHRLAGHASDPARARTALETDGVNALVVDAFRDQCQRDAK
jgi:hypothetical protein